MPDTYDEPRTPVLQKNGLSEDEQEIDLGVLWQGVRRRLPAILLSSLALGAGTYFWSRSQPRVYEASARLLSTNTQAQETTGLLNGLGRAAPLPDGVVAQVVGSPLVLGEVIKQVRTSTAVQEPERTRLVQALQDDLRMQTMKTIKLEADIQTYSGGNGIYTLHAQARTPEAARVLADLSSQALLNWDRGRALEGLRRAQAGFQAQLTQVEQQLQSAGAQERQVLVSRQASIQSNLIQISLLEDSITGVLSPLTSAVQPAAPVAPRPFRNALIVAALTLLLGLLYAVLRTLLDRTVRQEDDLLNLGLPVLASVPKLRKRDVLLSGIVRAGRSAGLYEAVGFLRVNLMGTLRHVERPVIMITSTAPEEGKSSLTATLADGFGSSGQRVLIVDLDLRRGTQAEVWAKYDQTSNWTQLVGQGGAKTSQEALLNPQNVQVLRAENNVDVLPAGSGTADSMRLLSQADLDGALKLWKQHYDVVLIDTAPLLALADGLLVGKQVDGVVLVVEAGKTPLPNVRAAMNRARQNNLNLLGTVINKVNVNSYGYTGYAYAPRT
ncbi:AAA family ATPase [Deinococcus taklimakanensis]|uniref:AAA family ATPase n=1 Tax=Deinococcus taklimakanensis TaxID=536443 RepID=A0ABW5P1T2_9DEIO